MTWEIRIDDDDSSVFDADEVVTGEVLNISETLNGYEECQFRIINSAANRAKIASNHDIRIQYKGTTIFVGRLTGAEYSQHWLTCISYNKAFELMRRRTVTANYQTTAGAADTDIFEDICVAAGVTRGTCAGTNIKTRFHYTICDDAARWLAQFLDSDIWTVPAIPMTVNIGSRGSNKGALSIIAVSKRGIDRALQRDKVITIGWDEFGIPIERTTGAGDDVHVIRDKTARDSTTLDNLGSYHLDRMNTESSGVRVQTTIGTGYNIYPGDTITINDATLNLSGSYKVWKTVKKSTTVDLQVDRLNMTTEEYVASLRKYEDQGIYLAGITNIAIGEQGWGTNIKFYPGSAVDTNIHNSFRWDSDGAGANATIKFADTTSITITAGNDTALAAATNYIYYVKSNEDPTTLYLAASYDDLDEPNNVPIVKIRTPQAASTTESVEIWPLFNAVEGNPLIGSSFLSADVIITPDFRTAWDVGVNPGSSGIAIFNETAGPLGWGIFGYKANAVKQFYLLASDGTAYAGAGAVVLDVNGITILGQKVKFRDTGDTKTFGWVQGYDETYGTESYESVALIADTGKSVALKTDNMQIFLFEGDGAEPAALYIEPDTNDVYFSANPAGAHKDVHLVNMNLIPTLDETLGAPAATFRYFIPRSKVIDRPDPSATTVGMLWMSRQEAGAKEYVWVCVQNDANNYEWIQLGIST